MIWFIQRLMISIFRHRIFSLLLVFAAGALASLSMAPLNLWPVLFVAIPVLYACVFHAPSPLRAGLYGWLFGFGYFMFSLSWIGNALLVEGNDFKWAWPLAVAGLPFGIAFFWGIAMGVSKKFLRLDTFIGWIGFVCVFAVFEWLRGHLFTGFPWNLFGYTWADTPAMFGVLQLSDVYILTWLTIMWASVPACFLCGDKAKAGFKRVAFAAALFIVCVGYGVMTARDVQYHDTVNVRIVQPNIDQADKWERTLMWEHFTRHVDLSRNLSNIDKPTIIVWPETAVSFHVLNYPEAMSDIVSMLQEYPEGSVLITGILRRDMDNETYGNSIVMFEQSGATSNVYDKHHLVPFGEYIPFQRYIPLAPVAGFSGFKAGDGLKSMSTPMGLNYSPLVCYEILFPGQSVGHNQPVDFIVNATNDAWYGDSAGPRQHLVISQYRAIENGVPVIRAANTGVSALIAPNGHIAGASEIFEQTAYNINLPKVFTQPEFLIEYKNYFSPLFLFGSMFSAIFISFLTRKKQTLY